MLVLNARMEGISMSLLVEIRDTRDRDMLRSVVLRTLSMWAQASLMDWLKSKKLLIKVFSTMKFQDFS